MSTTSTPNVSPRLMPARPNIEFIKNEAKRRLSVLRANDPELKLTSVQFDIAREYGFSSWRALRTALEHTSPFTMEAVGDWIGHLPYGIRVALHVGLNGITMDSPDYGAFGFAVSDFVVGVGRMSFILPRINATLLRRVERR